MDGLRQPQPRHHRRNEREGRRRPDWRGIADTGEHAAQRRPEDEPEADELRDILSELEGGKRSSHESDDE